MDKKDKEGIAHQLIADSSMDTFPTFKLRDVSSYKLIKSFIGQNEELYLVQISSIRGVVHSKRVPVDFK